MHVSEKLSHASSTQRVQYRRTIIDMASKRGQEESRATPDTIEGIKILIVGRPFVNRLK